MLATVTDLDWGEVTVMVMEPAPGVEPAAIVSGSVTPPANGSEAGPSAGPPPVEQPTVQERPVPLSVPAPALAVAVIVVPAAIVFPFKSATVYVKLAEGELRSSVIELVLEAILAHLVDMMMMSTPRWRASWRCRSCPST